MEFTEILTGVGTPMGLAALFIWWTYKLQQNQREDHKHTQEKLEEVQNGQYKESKELAASAIEVITLNTGAMEKTADSLNRLNDSMLGVECLRSDRRKDG